MRHIRRRLRPGSQLESDATAEVTRRSSVTSQSSHAEDPEQEVPRCVLFSRFESRVLNLRGGVTGPTARPVPSHSAVVSNLLSVCRRGISRGERQIPRRMFSLHT